MDPLDGGVARAEAEVGVDHVHHEDQLAVVERAVEAQCRRLSVRESRATW